MINSEMRPRGLKRLAVGSGICSLITLILSFQFSNPCDSRNELNLSLWLKIQGAWSLLWDIGDLVFYREAWVFEQGFSHLISQPFEEPWVYASVIGVYDGVWWLVAWSSFIGQDCLVSHPLSVLLLFHLCWFLPHLTLRGYFVSEMREYLDRIRHSPLPLRET